MYVRDGEQIGERERKRTERAKSYYVNAATEGNNVLSQFDSNYFAMSLLREIKNS